MSYVDFQAEQKVVFIGDYSTLMNEIWAVEFGIEFPQSGEIYSIREIVLIKHLDAEYKVGLRLHEVVNPETPVAKTGGLVDTREIMPPQEIAWDPSEFRPLIHRETDISVFTTMLTDQRERV